MFTRIRITPMYVTDQDEALRYYCDTLGFEVDSDVDLGNMRWLTVRLPNSDQAVILQHIGDQPDSNEETQRMLRDLTERGATTWMVLGTDDCQRTYETLVERGAEIVQEPTRQFYGIDMAIRDPFGNQIRITQQG